MPSTQSPQWVRPSSTVVRQREDLRVGPVQLRHVLGLAADVGVMQPGECPVGGMHHLHRRIRCEVEDLVGGVPPGRTATPLVLEVRARAFAPRRLEAAHVERREVARTLVQDLVQEAVGDIPASLAAVEGTRLRRQRLQERHERLAEGEPDAEAGGVVTREAEKRAPRRRDRAW